MDNDIKRDVATFICNHIDSVEQLEILLLLLTEPHPWSAIDIASQLRTNPSSTTNRLNSLVGQGIIVHIKDKKLYQYIKTSEKMNEVLDLLVEAHRTHRYRIIDLIFTKSHSAISSFAEAFRIRKKDDNDG